MTDNRKSLYFEGKSYIGGFYGGDRKSLETKANYRLGDAFTAALTWSHNNIDMTPFAESDGLAASRGDFKVNVARLRMSYSITPKMQIQMLVQSDDRKDLLATNLRFSWLQDANSGLYIVYNEVDDLNIIGPMEKRREFVLKYSRIFNVLREGGYSSKQTMIPAFATTMGSVPVSESMFKPPSQGSTVTRP